MNLHWLSPPLSLYQELYLCKVVCGGLLILLCCPGIVVRNTFVTYDREHEKIGFWKTNCSELWERLNVTGAPTPEPSADNRLNSTTVVPPAMAPTGLSHNIIPGKISF